MSGHTPFKRITLSGGAMPIRLQKFTDIQKWLPGICLAGILCAAPVTASVQTITHGASLMASCQQALIALTQKPGTPDDTGQNSAFVCMAYLSGVMATAQHANDQAKLRYSLVTDGRGNRHDLSLYCFDWQLSYQKIARIVLEFGRNNPVYLQQPAHKLAIRALQNAFPCR